MWADWNMRSKWASRRNTAGPLHGVVTADAFEHAGTVMESVGRHVDGGVRPRNDLAILPDELALRKERHPVFPC